jgi:hypothetical protein
MANSFLVCAKSLLTPSLNRNIYLIQPPKFFETLPQALTRNPSGNGSSGSNTNWWNPVIYVLPVTFGITAGKTSEPLPTCVEAIAWPTKRVPMMLSVTNGFPRSSCPRVYRSATSAQVPVPHGDRSTIWSPKITAFRLSTACPDQPTALHCLG